ncbi:MAG TPA: glycosyltransferase [Polyangia bacterium]|jgi:glycosyltransferase involved in cell wall biosynthesis|nr:glycosyltransferase [Polyangia bacterium]
MRVVFFVQGEAVPAARARGLVIAGALEAAGLTCAVRIPRPSVYGDTRLPSPWNRLRPLYAPFAAWSRMIQMRDLRADDVIFFQRPMLELPIVALERWAARGRRVIFDFDDAIFERVGAPRKFRALVSLADRVIAGSRYLADAAAAPAKTTIIPTVVDTDRWRELPPRATRGRDVVIGWTGLSTNYAQLGYAAGGIARALERTGARLVVISDRPPPPSLAPLRPEFVRWRPETEVEDLSRLDIGVMPLPDGPIERGKCAYKLIQYMALGRPGVASPVGANGEVVTSGVDGFLPTDDRSWEETLVSLVQDPAARQAIGRRGRLRVEAAYSLRAVTPRYLDVLTNW